MVVEGCLNLTMGMAEDGEDIDKAIERMRKATLLLVRPDLNM